MLNSVYFTISDAWQDVRAVAVDGHHIGWHWRAEGDPNGAPSG
jgi:hypothetical protein